MKTLALTTLTLVLAQESLAASLFHCQESGGGTLKMFLIPKMISPGETRKYCSICPLQTEDTPTAARGCWIFEENPIL